MGTGSASGVPISSILVLVGGTNHVVGPEMRRQNSGGIHRNVYRPRRHDLTVLQNSECEGIRHECFSYNNEQYYVFEDKAYTFRPYLIRPFIGAALSEEQEKFNTFMSSLRQSVEHHYKDLKQQWVSQDFPRSLRGRKAPTALLYKASAILWNIRVCAYITGQVTKDSE